MPRFDRTFIPSQYTLQHNFVARRDVRSPQYILQLLSMHGQTIHRLFSSLREHVPWSSAPYCHRSHALRLSKTIARAQDSTKARVQRIPIDRAISCNATEIEPPGKSRWCEGGGRAHASISSLVEHRAAPCLVGYSMHRHLNSSVTMRCPSLLYYHPVGFCSASHFDRT